MGPHPVQRWCQQRTSQPLTPVAPPRALGMGVRGRGGGLEGDRLLLRIGSRQGPRFISCTLPFPVWGTWPVRLGPACLPSWPDRGKLGDCLWQLKTRFRCPSCQSVSTLQIIGISVTYQLVIKLPPGPAEELTAGLALLCLNYESRCSLVVYLDILYFCS